MYNFKYKEAIYSDTALRLNIDNNMPIEPTDDEKLESLKQQIIDVTFQLYKLEIAGFNDIGLKTRLEGLIVAHKELAETISFSKKEEEVNENV